jgi:hypothetical protein
MKHSHRLNNPGTTALRISTKVGFTTLSLLLMFFVGNTLLAQNPAYSFASGIGSTENDIGRAIALDANGNLYVTGGFTGTVDFDPGAGTANLTSVTPVVGGSIGTDIFVASYDASGNYRWAFNVGGNPQTGSGDNSGWNITIDGSGNVVVSGQFNGTMDFNPGVVTANLASVGGATFVAKYSPTGNYLWAFQIGPYSADNDVAIDANDNIVVVGNFQGTVDFNPGSGTASLTSVRAGGPNGGSNTVDIFVAKYSSSGTYLWAFRIGNEFYESADAVDIDGSGNIYLIGQFNTGINTASSTVDFDPAKARANLTGPGLYVARYTGAGAYSWAFKIASEPSQTGNDLAVDANGNVAVTGGFKGTVDFNPGTGTANLTGVGTNSNIFVARYSSSGSYQWAFTPAVGYTYGGVTTDGNGDICVAGIFNGTNDFDPGTGTASLVGSNYVAKYSASGSYQWAFCPTTTVGAMIRAIAVDGGGNIYLTGSISGTVDFDPSESTAILTSAGKSDIFIAKYTETTQPKRATDAGMGNEENGIALQVAPNPFTGDFTFHHDGTTARIEIIDMMGRVVESREVDGAMEVTLGAELPAGAYMVRTTQGEIRRQVMVRKVR